MKKKLIILFFLITTFAFAAQDIDDIQYINKLFENEFYDEAILELKIFIKKYPNSEVYDASVNMLAQSYYRNKEYEKAEEKFLKLLETDFKNDSYYFLAKIAIYKNEIDKLKKYLKNIPSSSTRYKNLVQQVAEKLYSDEKYKEAEEYYKKLIQFSGDYYTNALLKLAVINFNNDEYIKSSAFLEEYVNIVEDIKEKNISLINYILGYSNSQIGDKKLVEKYYLKNEKYFFENEFGTKSLYNLTKLYQEQGKIQKIKEYANKLLETKYFKNAAIILADIYENEGEFLRSEALYKKVLEIEENPKFRFMLTHLYLQEKKYNLAYETIQKLEDTKYKNEYYYYSIFILYNLEKYTELVQEYKNIINMDLTFEDKDKLYNMIANSAKKTDDKETAVLYYSNLDGLQPLYELALIHYEQNNNDEFLDVFNRYIKEYPEDKSLKKDFYIMASSIYIENEQFEKAEKLYTKYLNENDDRQILNNLIAVLYNQSKYDKLIEYTQNKKDNPQFQYYLAIAYLNKHNYKLAENNLVELLEVDDKTLQEKVYRNYVNTLYSLERYNEVVKYTSEYLEKDFKQYEIDMITKKGISYFKLEEYQNARVVFKKLIYLNELEDYANFMLAEIAYNLNDKELAKLYYKDVIIKYPESIYAKDSLYWIISITYENKKYEESKEYIKLYFNRFPNDKKYFSEVAYFLGNIYIINDELELAVIEFEKVLKNTTDSEIKENVISMIINSYFKNEDYKKALEWVDKATNEEYKIIWNGILNERLGNDEIAISNYKKLVDNDKYGDRANYYLGKFYFDKKEYEEAEEYFRKVMAYDVSKYKDDAIFNLGLLYENTKNYARAITTLMRIKLLYSNSDLAEIANIKIAENYERIDKIDKAIKIYKEFEAQYKDSKYYNFVLEKLIAYYYNNDQKEEAMKFYEKLKEIDLEKAKKYESYFNSGGE